MKIIRQLGLRRTFVIVLAILIRPWLWPSVLRFVPPGWWTYAPYLPLPPTEYLEFRLDTAYGKGNWAKASAADTIQFLNWCRGTHKLAQCLRPVSKPGSG